MINISNHGGILSPIYLLDTKSLILHLPLDIFFYLANKCDFQTQCKMRRVCKKWNKHIVTLKEHTLYREFINYFKLNLREKSGREIHQLPQDLSVWKPNYTEPLGKKFSSVFSFTATFDTRQSDILIKPIPPTKIWFPLILQRIDVIEPASDKEFVIDSEQQANLDFFRHAVEQVNWMIEHKTYDHTWDKDRKNNTTKNFFGKIASKIKEKIPKF